MPNLPKLGYLLDSSVLQRGIPAIGDEARLLRDVGIVSLWVPQRPVSFDATTLAAYLGAAVPELEIGTAVVPIFRHHPLALAGQAVVAQAACPGGFTLGIGLSHRQIVEDILGMPYERPVSQLEDYLPVMTAVLAGQDSRWIGTPPAPRVSILLAALGPRMLSLAGSACDGVITWMVGPRTLASHIVPGLRESAQRSGRDVSRVVALLPVCVTDDPEPARMRISGALSGQREYESYQKTLAREGGELAEMGLVGREDQVVEQLVGLDAVGVTDVVVIGIGSDAEAKRTRNLIHELVLP
jgi:5,10-methylenetetrahydromethanopterin reductase